jgi:hypothetical protein
MLLMENIILPSLLKKAKNFMVAMTQFVFGQLGLHSGLIKETSLIYIGIYRAD